MIITMMSVLLCLALAVKLIFFSDQHRSESRLFYRAVLFLSALYAGKQVIGFVYHPEQPTSPWLFAFHVVLFLGAFWVRPNYLPWNHIR